jgi:DNA modification methylase
LKSGTVSYGNKAGGYSYAGSEYEVDGFVKSCKPQAPSNYGDSGGASRFYYCAKASKKERRGSKHPTVKPLALMRYLCRLITPPGGIILDPFAGSGTTGEAALLEGFEPLLIELESQYVQDIKSRLNEVESSERDLLADVFEAKI